MKQLIKQSYGYYQSPIGLIEIVVEEKIIGLTFINKKVLKRNETNNFLINNCIKELELYFQKKITNFSLPLEIKGTFFQELVWSETCKIPYGTTITYSELARRIKKPKANRAVGNALAKNPLAIIIPCHRVNSVNKKNSNYLWGKEKKQFLQKLEKSY